MQNAVLAHFSSLFLPGILCGRQCDQGFFQFTLKTAIHWFILCHLLKPAFVSCLLLCTHCSTCCRFQTFPFVSETAASFPFYELQSSLLCIFTLITFPVLLSVSQSICQTLLLNQHKSIPAPSLQQPLAISVISRWSFSSSAVWPLCPPDWAFSPDTSLLCDSYTDNLWDSVCSLLLNSRVQHFYYFKACYGLPSACHKKLS